MKNLLYLIIIFFNLSPLYALELKGNFFQGNLIVGKTEPKSKIFIDNKEIKVSSQGFFAFGLSKNRENNVLIKIIKNGASKSIVKKVYKKNIEYKK